MHHSGSQEYVVTRKTQVVFYVKQQLYHIIVIYNLHNIKLNDVH